MRAMIGHFTVLILYLGAQAQSQTSSLTKEFNHPLKVGDVITITGTGYAGSVGQIRFHSEPGSCHEAKEDMDCNPLVLKLYARRHKIIVLKRGPRNRNRDELVKSLVFGSFDKRKNYRLVVEVITNGYRIAMNDHPPVNITEMAEFAPATMIRVQSGRYRELTLKRYYPLNVPDCGTREVYRSKLMRIVNGQNAGEAEYPWQAAIRRKKIYVWSPFPHLCGGTLISSCWVVTAAHCVTPMYSKADYEIRVGDLYNGNDTWHQEMEDMQTFDIEEIHYHANYTSKPVPRNDVALIRLKSNSEDGKCAKFSKYVKPACLPDPRTEFFPGKECKISGWGAKNWTDSPRHYPHYLQHGSVNLEDFNTCRKMFGKTETNEAKVSDGMLCAGSDNGVDTCQGDSGGPLVCELGNDIFEEYPFVLWGITSWGEECAHTKKPGIYTSVPYYLKWIKDTRDASEQGDE